MPLFLQIALGIVLAIVGLVALFTAPRVLRATVDGMMQGNVFQMAARFILLPGVALLGIFATRVTLATFRNFATVDPLMADPLSVAAYVFIGLGCGCYFLGDLLAARADAKRSHPGK